MVRPGVVNASRSFVDAHPALNVAGTGDKSEAEAGAGMTRGVPVRLVLHALDAFGCALRSGGDTVVATLRARVDVVAVVVDNADGSYGIDFTPTHSGPALLQVTIGGRAVGTGAPADADGVLRCPSASLSNPAPKGAPYVVLVADRRSALVGAAILSGADSPAPSGADLTLAAWFKPVAAGGAGAGVGELNSSTIGVVARGTLTGSTPAGFSLSLAGDVSSFTASVAVVGGSGSSVRSITVPLPAGIHANGTGRWTHLAVVYSGGNTWVAYVDGVAVQTQTFTGAAANLTAVPLTATTTTGDARGGSDPTRGTAAVDDVRVYTSAALTAAQALGASQCPPGVASGQLTPDTRFALDEGAGELHAATDGGKLATLITGAYWLPAGAPSLLNTLVPGGVSVMGGAATIAVASNVSFSVATVDRCGVPLVRTGAATHARCFSL